MKVKPWLDFRQLTLSIALSVGIAPVCAASDVFISEYVEGSSYNKAIEIYNDTGQNIDLSTYELQYYFNGSVTPGHTIALSGSLANGDVYVIAEDAADPSLRGLADLLDTSTSWFNGDDAVVLLNAGVIIDSIGQIGLDPGSEWGAGDTSSQTIPCAALFAKATRILMTRSIRLSNGKVIHKILLTG